MNIAQSAACIMNLCFLFKSNPLIVTPALWQYIQQASSDILGNNILVIAQIRAEEVSQVQYMCDLKFSAVGLDKKVCSPSRY